MRARVFLRQSLFSAPPCASGGAAPGASESTGHVPQNAAILLGTVTDQSGFGLTFKADGYADERGRILSGPPRTLLIPSAKIDHVWVEE